MTTGKNNLVGIMSDSHDNRHAVKQAVSFFNDVSCGLVIHAGDFVAPFAAGELEALDCPVKAVFGNCDGEKTGLKQTFQDWGEINPEPFHFDWLGMRFLLTHTHFRLPEYTRGKNLDIIIYGHTHKPEVRRENSCLIVNPGEAGGWLSGKKTIALLDVKEFSVDIIPLD